MAAFLPLRCFSSAALRAPSCVKASHSNTLFYFCCSIFVSWPVGPRVVFDIRIHTYFSPIRASILFSHTFAQTPLLVYGTSMSFSTMDQSETKFFCHNSMDLNLMNFLSTSKLDFKTTLVKSGCKIKFHYVILFYGS